MFNLLLTDDTGFTHRFTYSTRDRCERAVMMWCELVRITYWKISEPTPETIA